MKISNKNWLFAVTIAAISFANSAPEAAAQSEYQWVPLYSWWNNDRKDNFTTTEERWRASQGTERGGYRMFGVQGLVLDPDQFGPDNPPPRGTVPIYRWYSPSREDNFTTTDPRWRPDGAIDHGDYIRPLLIGYMYSDRASDVGATLSTWSWWNSGRGDNFMTTQNGWRANPETIDVNNYHIVNGRRNDEGYTLYRLEGYSATPRQPRIRLADISGGRNRIISTGFNEERDEKGCPAGTVLDAEAAQQFIDDTYTEGDPVESISRGSIYFYDPDLPIRLRLSSVDTYNLPIKTLAFRFREGGLFNSTNGGTTALGLTDIEASTRSYLVDTLDETARDYEGSGFTVVDTFRSSVNSDNDQTLSLSVGNLGTNYRFVISAENSLGLSVGLRIWMLPDTLCVAEP
ncbi:MAG: hypothetical protein AAF683_08015 [Pseudomonadota bacterium]